jgi:plastocyanin
MQRSRPVVVALGSLLLLLLGVLAVATPAHAATRTVVLDENGPSPRSVTINAGDKVAFVNHDSVSHTISDNAGPWSFHSTIRAGGSATTGPFSRAGHYGYNDAFVVAVFQQNVDGSIEVRAAAPSPTPKPTATKSASPKPTATRSGSPSPSATASRSASPTPTASASQSPTPTATLGTVPPAPVPTTSEPKPAVASPAGSPTVAYGPTSEIAQSSAHRYGIPVLLALLAAAGVLSLLVRFLLAQPAGMTPASRRTSGEGSEPDAS